MRLVGTETSLLFTASTGRRPSGVVRGCAAKPVPDEIRDRLRAQG
jgi:hypothetical protein